jgi:hypothetical protein
VIEAEPAVFDLSKTGARVQRTNLATTILLLVSFATLGVIGVFSLVLSLSDKASGNSTVLLILGITFLAAPAVVLPLFLLSLRYAVRAEVDSTGVRWVPSWGSATRTIWTNPGVRLTLFDYQSNANRPPALRGLDDLAVLGPGMFPKFPTRACFDAILESARKAGLRVEEATVQAGTKFERRVIRINH